MIKVVIKKGGAIEKFDIEKIKKSILAAISQTQLPKEKQTEILEKILSSLLDFLKNKNEVFTTEIEAKILMELEKELPEAAAFWREYRIKKSKTN